MSNYFSYFNQVNYGFSGDTKRQSVVNITQRFIIRKKILEKDVIYYDYNIQDGDRPDTIAAKYYGNPNYDWIVMLVNNIFDVNYDWPMDSFIFEKFLRDKYGSVAEAKATTQRYEKIIRGGTQDSFGNPIKKNVVTVDKTTFDTLGINERQEISAYEYEEELNEAKRTIQILDRRYLQQILREAEDILE